MLCADSAKTSPSSGRVLPSPSHSHRSGYTLAEMLIAMVLVAALMSTAWGILSMYSSLLTAGKSESSRQQLVRSLFQILSEDLSAVSLPPDTSVDPLSQANTATTDSSDSFSSSASQPTVDRQTAVGSSSTPAAITLEGTPTSLRLTVCRPVVEPPKQLSAMEQLNERDDLSGDVADVSAGNAAWKVPEFQTIIYQLQPFGQSEGPSKLSFGLYRLQTDAATVSALESQQTDYEEGLTFDDVALSRSTLESLLFPQEDRLNSDIESGESDEDLAEPSYEYIPEVVDCRFEYYDGESWWSYWSDNQSSVLPAAVRVTLDVVSLNEVETLKSLDSDRGSGIPLDDEFASSFSDTTAGSERSGPEDDSTIDVDPLRRIRPKEFRRTILLDTTIRLKKRDDIRGRSTESGL